MTTTLVARPAPEPQPLVLPDPPAPPEPASAPSVPPASSDPPPPPEPVAPSEPKPLSRAAQRRLPRTVAPVRVSARVAGLEVSAHVLPSKIGLFVPHAFPGAKGRGRRLRVVCTIQPARFDIMLINEATEAERCRLFREYASYADAFAAALPPGRFCEYGDLDGVACRAPQGPSSFNEVEVVAAVIGYHRIQIGGVSIVDHPTLSTSIYLGSIVTDVADDEICSVLSVLG